MSSTHLDEFCEWVHDKRRLCSDEAEFRVTMLTDPCIDSSHFKYSMDAITYNPTQYVEIGIFPGVTHLD